MSIAGWDAWTGFPPTLGRPKLGSPILGPHASIEGIPVMEGTPPAIAPTERRQ